MPIVKNPYQQLLNAQKNEQSTLELLGVSKTTNNLIGNLSAAAGGGAALGAAGAAGAAGGDAAAANETAAGGAAAGAAGAAGTAAKALAGAGVLGFLTSGQNWIRLLEVIAGFVLIAMGLHQLTGAGNTVIGVAKTAAKAGR